jgi:hypothetical protein
MKIASVEAAKLRVSKVAVCCFSLAICMIFTRVGTYVQRGSKFCFVVVDLVLLGETLVRIVACSLARQPCPAAFPGSLAEKLQT